MNKKLQLKIMVFLCIIIVIFVYFYIGKGFSFNVAEDFGDMKDSIETDAEGLFDSNIINDLRDRFNNLKEEISDGQDDVKSEITEKVLNQLNDQNNIIYGYEPWGIEFSYDNSMIKEIDQDQEKILLYYEDIENLKVVIERYNLEGSFNDWLNNNYDLQSLDKIEYNNLIFWKQNLSDDKNRIAEYYVNVAENIFIINLTSANITSENYWDSLENIVKSFSLINL